jgi:hypothetical protein
MLLIVVLIYTKSSTLHLFRICFYKRAMTSTVNLYRGLSSILHRSMCDLLRIEWQWHISFSNDCSRMMLLQKSTTVICHRRYITLAFDSVF